MKNRTYSWAFRVLGALAALTLTVGCGAAAPTSSGSVSNGSQPAGAATTTPASVSGTSFPMTVTDFTGHTQTFEQQPQRIAVVSGTPLNIFYDAGGTAIAGPNLTENIRLTEDRADEMRALPQLGLPRTIDSEALVGLNPDLVITQAGAQTALDLFTGNGQSFVVLFLFDQPCELARAGDVGPLTDHQKVRLGSNLIPFEPRIV